MATIPTNDIAVDLARLNFRKRPLTNMLTCNKFGRHKMQEASGSLTPLTTVQTHNTLQELASEGYTGLWIGIHNFSPNAVTGVKVQISVATATGADNVLATTPINGGWGTVFTINLAPRIDVDVPSIYWLPFYPKRSVPRTDGGNKALVGVRTQWPTGTNLCVPANNTYYWAGSGAAQNVYKGTFQAVAGIDTPSSYTNTAINYTDVYVPIIRYMSTKAGRQALINGDSTVEGIGGDIRAFGAIQRACNALSSPQAPFEYYNAAIHAAGPLTYVQYLENIIGVIRPTVVSYSAYSVNNTANGGLSYARLEDDYGCLARAIKAVNDLGYAPPLLVYEGLPTTEAFRATGAGDQLRVALNNELAGMTGIITMVGYASSVSQLPNTTTQILPKTALISGDGAHYNNDGQLVLQAIVQPYLAAT